MATEDVWVPTYLEVGNATNIKFRGKHARCHWADEDHLGINGFLWHIVDQCRDVIDKRGEGGILEHGVWFTIEPINELHWQREPIDPPVKIKTLLDKINEGGSITIPESTFHIGQWIRLESGPQVMWSSAELLRITLDGGVWFEYRILSSSKDVNGVTFSCVKVEP